MKTRSTIRAAWSGGLFSPAGLFLRAVLMAVIFVILHLCGLREHASFISETVGSTSMSWETSAFLGVAYLLFYLGCVVVVPILLLASGILWVAGRYFPAAKK